MVSVFKVHFVEKHDQHFRNLTLEVFAAKHISVLQKSFSKSPFDSYVYVCWYSVLFNLTDQSHCQLSKLYHQHPRRCWSRFCLIFTRIFMFSKYSRKITLEYKVKNMNSFVFPVSASSKTRCTKIFLDTSMTLYRMRKLQLNHNIWKGIFWNNKNPGVFVKKYPTEY